MDSSHPAPSFVSGAFFMTLSVLGLALTGLFGKFAVLDYSIYSVLFYRFVIAFVLYLLILLFTGQLKGAPHLSHWKIHFFRAIFSLGSIYFFYLFIKTHSLLNGVTFLNTGPLFIPLIEALFLRKKIEKITWFAIILAFIGVLFILKPSQIHISDFYGLIGGVFQGASQVIFGISAKTEKPEVSVLYLFFLYVVISFWPYLFIPASPSSGGLSWFLFLAAALGLSTIINQFFRAAAYQHSTPSKLAAFLYAAVLFAALFDWIFFHTPPDLYSCLGALLVVIAGAIKIRVFRWNPR